jgi:hypothetical protein
MIFSDYSNPANAMSKRHKLSYESKIMKFLRIILVKELYYIRNSIPLACSLISNASSTNA